MQLKFQEKFSFNSLYAWMLTHLKIDKFENIIEALSMALKYFFIRKFLFFVYVS